MKNHRIVTRRSGGNRRENYGNRGDDDVFHNGGLIYLIKGWDCQCVWREADLLNFDRRQGPRSKEVHERRGAFRGVRGRYRHNRRYRQLKKY